MLFNEFKSQCSHTYFLHFCQTVDTVTWFDRVLSIVRNVSDQSSWLHCKRGGRGVIMTETEYFVMSNCALFENTT